MSGLKKNPFVITFGKKPIEYIHRPYQTDEIMSMFTTDPITNQLFIICGPRGSGKTVLLSDIANQLERDPEWAVIRCAPTSDILSTVADGLDRYLFRNSVSADVSLNIPAVGNVHLQKKDLSPGTKYRIEDALRSLNDQNKKLLIAIDEITNTPQMQDFASNLQIWMGQDFPVFFLGTALYERINELQNVSNLTFLYRAPKIELQPLDMVSIARSYQKVLNVSEERSEELARLTMGYSFAFQALGYIYWNAMPVDDLKMILPDYDSILSNAAYSKMWQELSEGDRALCAAIANCSDSSVSEIRRTLGESDPNRFNQRRIRLRNRGIILSPRRGHLTFALPRFQVFVRSALALYED